MVHTSGSLLEVQGLSKTVPSPEGPLHLLEGLNFTIPHGEVVAVVGTSGSGKSTLLGLLAGLDLPSTGRILVDGQDLTTWSEDQRACWRRDNVGFVFQNFQLLENLTALENVMLPLELRGVRSPRAKAVQILERIGLGHRLKHLPVKLSGGEIQRVAIARAFANEPRWLFADEPTGSLDTNTGRRIVQLLLELNRESGTTLVIVTHDHELAGQCHRRLRLHAGRLVGGAGQDSSTDSIDGA